MLSFCGLVVGVSASRSAARWRISGDGGISGLGGCRIVLAWSGPGGERRAEVAVIGVLGRERLALPVREPGGERSVSGGQVLDPLAHVGGCARWRRLAIDATPYSRPDAECSPGRGHVHHDACRRDSTRKTIPGWEYQFTGALGHLRTAWAALVDVERTTAATRTRQTIRQVKNLLSRLEVAGARRAPGHNGRRVQRRRADRRASRAAGAPADPAGVRQRVLRRPDRWGAG